MTQYHPSACVDTARNEPTTARPIRVMFIKTSMPVGGAETLLVDLIRRLDRRQFAPELCCLKTPGPLGEELSAEVPVHSHLLSNKYDLRVLPRLRRLLSERGTDAVVTVGAGDKMFWGRWAARRARVPVVISALHSTGWPDDVGRLNRLLTPMTDTFVAVAPSHGRYLVEQERFPKDKVSVIPNGVDTDRFSSLPDPHAIRRQIGLNPANPVVTIVAALRPEKNHEMFLNVAQGVLLKIPEAQFLIVGDGPQRPLLEEQTARLQIRDNVHFLGSRDDIPAILSATDVFALTSHNEANPVSILEAMSIGRPVVATDVGSVKETVVPGETGLLVEPDDVDAFTTNLTRLLWNPLLRNDMGSAARKRVMANWSVQSMVQGYEQLLTDLFVRKTSG